MIKKIIPYIEIRNQIVHEGLDEGITSKDVLAAFDTLLQILRHLEQIAKKQGVPTE